MVTNAPGCMLPATAWACGAAGTVDVGVTVKPDRVMAYDIPLESTASCRGGMFTRDVPNTLNTGLSASGPITTFEPRSIFTSSNTLRTSPETVLETVCFTGVVSRRKLDWSTAATAATLRCEA